MEKPLPYQKFFADLRRAIIENNIDYPPGISADGRKLQLDLCQILSEATPSDVRALDALVVDYYEREIKGRSETGEE